MNKQELIEEIEDLKDLNQLFGNNPGYIKIDTVMGLVSKLDEPEKVTVPQFVAEWINSVKTNGLKFKNTYGFYERIEPSDDVYRVIYYIFKESIANKEIRFWVGENTDTFARAWLDGYEVEKEKQYLVKIKGVACPYLNYDTINELWFYNQKIEGAYTKTKHTRKELEEAGFGEVFNSPLFEVEEVE